MGQIFNHNTGKALNKTNSSGTNLSYITTSNLYWGSFELDTLKQMYFTESEIEKCTVRHGDLLVCEGGDIGRAAIWNYDYEIRIQNHIHKLRPFLGVNVKLYFYVFWLYKFSGRISGKGIGIQGLSSNQLHNIIIPLPPLQEQNHIVSKINKLLNIVDTIEINKTDLQSTVQQAKSKILDLAIQGKLVPQDPNDEPASVLLERIRAEKEELIKQGKIKRDKKESVIFKSEDNSYYIQTGSLIEELGDWSLNCLPDSWGICCLGEVCDYGSCVNVGTDCIEDDAWILDLEDIEKDTGRVIKKVKKSERSAMSTKHSFKKGQVLYSKLRPYLNKVVLADEDGYCTSEILPLDFNSLVLPAYARYYLMTPAFLAYANRCSYGVKMPRLSTSDGKKAIMTIPPLAEQKRIVAAIETYYSKLDKIAEMLT